MYSPIRRHIKNNQLKTQALSCTLLAGLLPTSVKTELLFGCYIWPVPRETDAFSAHRILCTPYNHAPAYSLFIALMPYWLTGRKTPSYLLTVLFQDSHVGSMCVNFYYCNLYHLNFWQNYGIFFTCNCHNTGMEREITKS